MNQTTYRIQQDSSAVGFNFKKRNDSVVNIKKFSMETSYDH